MGEMSPVLLQERPACLDEVRLRFLAQPIFHGGDGRDKVLRGFDDGRGGSFARLVHNPEDEGGSDSKDFDADRDLALVA